MVMMLAAVLVDHPHRELCVPARRSLGSRAKKSFESAIAQSNITDRERDHPVPPAAEVGDRFCIDNSIPPKKAVPRHNEFRLEIRDVAT
jgi:hypothetical protein